MALGLGSPAWAGEQYRSILLQNDFFLGHDGGGYTNGLVLSQIDAASAGDAQVEPSFLLRSIAPVLGLPTATLTATSLGQIMVTPRDIARVRPDPADVPYAGALVFRSAQVHVHGDRAELLAFSVGVIGPASGAAQTQRLVHRVVGAERPQGWDSQVHNRPLLGLERYSAWRFPWGDATADRAGSDFIALAGGAVGNLDSSAGLTLTYRHGTGLEKSFPAASRLAAHTADPLLLGSGWFGFTSVSIDRLFNYVGIGRDAPGEATSSLRTYRAVASAGFVYGWERSSLSFSMQAASPVAKASSRYQTYGSLTYTYRLD
ncbi:lipid A deacylase LpxR family protein [soil metagenome]